MSSSFREVGMKDSGERQTYPSGAQREPQKGRGHFHLLQTEAIRRLAIVLEKGAEKYSARNWEKGLPLSRFLDSTFRHLLQLFDGDTTEDHAGQAMWNIACYIQTKHWIEEGKLPEELDDVR